MSNFSTTTSLQSELQPPYSQPHSNPNARTAHKSRLTRSSTRPGGRRSGLPASSPCVHNRAARAHEAAECMRDGGNPGLSAVAPARIPDTHPASPRGPFDLPGRRHFVREGAAERQARVYRASHRYYTIRAGAREREGRAHVGRGPLACPGRAAPAPPSASR